MILNSKKIKELQSENDELKKLIAGFTEKENRLKQFDELIKKSRIEYANIALKKNQTAHTLEVLENQKAKLNNELHKISSEIKKLREIKVSEQNQVLVLGNLTSKSNQTLSGNNLESVKDIIYKEIESAEKRKNEIAVETFKFKKKFDELNKKIAEINQIKNALTSEVEKKKEEIGILIGRKKAISQEQNDDITSALLRQNEEKLKLAEDIQARINQLRNQEAIIIDRLTDKRSELQKLDKQLEEKSHLIRNEAELNNSLKQLSFVESAKKELLRELDIKIGAKEAHLTSLVEDCKSKTDSLNWLKNENKEISEKINSGNEKLKQLNESIEIATARLSDLDYSLNVLDKEFNNLFQDIENKKSIRTELDTQIISKQNDKQQIEDVIRELKETTSILSQLKNDIEKGSGQSAKRFTGVLQHYSSTINEMAKKKSDLERELNMKSKEIGEKDRLIEEKQSVLEEIENMLNAGRSNFTLFEDLMHFIAAQRKALRESKNILEDSMEKVESSNDIIIQENKLVEYENALSELLHSEDDYSSDLINSRISIEKEIEENKVILDNLKKNIVDSSSELSEMKESINKIKTEHEEHRVAINKLALMKQKLQEEINKQQIVADKYVRIKELIRQEQELIMKKRELADTDNLVDQPRAKEKIFEKHNPNWIKL
ncbi:MAG: hypothetical protein IPM14_11930 [bacterium]|nr:hypothetical protein [bacterium]